MDIRFRTWVRWVRTDFCEIDSPETSYVSVVLKVVTGNDPLVATFDFEVEPNEKMAIVTRDSKGMYLLRSPKEIQTLDPSTNGSNPYDLFWSIQFAQHENFHLLCTALRKEGLQFGKYLDLRNWMRKPSINDLNMVLNFSSTNVSRESKTLMAVIKPLALGQGTFEGFIFHEGINRKKDAVKEPDPCSVGSLFARKILVTKVK